MCTRSDDWQRARSAAREIPAELESRLYGRCQALPGAYLTAHDASSDGATVLVGPSWPRLHVGPASPDCGGPARLRYWRHGRDLALSAGKLDRSNSVRYGSPVGTPHKMSSRGRLMVRRSASARRFSCRRTLSWTSRNPVAHSVLAIGPTPSTFLPEPRKSDRASMGTKSQRRLRARRHRECSIKSFRSRGSQHGFRKSARSLPHRGTRARQLWLNGRHDGRWLDDWNDGRRVRLRHQWGDHLQDGEEQRWCSDAGLGEVSDEDGALLRLLPRRERRRGHDDDGPDYAIHSIQRSFGSWQA